MKVEIKGVVHDIQTKTGTNDKGQWTRTTLVVKTNQQYNNTVPVGFFNKEITVKAGDQVEVTAYVAGREYQGKYYAQIDGNEVRSLSPSTQPSETQPSQEFTPPPVPQPTEEEISDLPF